MCMLVLGLMVGGWVWCRGASVRACIVCVRVCVCVRSHMRPYMRPYVRVCRSFSFSLCVWMYSCASRGVFARALWFGGKRQGVAAHADDACMHVFGAWAYGFRVYGLGGRSRGPRV